jgi:hypothetical protein
MQEYNHIIDRYIDKWDKILFSTQPVDRAKATKAVIDAYGAMGRYAPEIFFLSSPSLEQNLNFISSSNLARDPVRLKSALSDTFENLLITKSIDESILDDRLTLKNVMLSATDRGKIFGEICFILYGQHVYNIQGDYNALIHKVFEYELYYTNAWAYDFYINNVCQEPDLEIWTIIKSLCEECPYLLTYEDVCVIIDRPSELHLDRELVPHAEGKAAIKYADGYELYCNHGTIIPAKYGQIHPSDWRAESIVFDEDNDVIRADSESIINILFNIGYQKFSQELPSLRERYWNNRKGSLRRFCNLIEYSFVSIMNWLEFHQGEYYILGEPINWHLMDFAAREIAAKLPYKLSQELEIFFSLKCEEKYRFAPGLNVRSLQESIQKSIQGLNGYPVKIFDGDRQEIYYVLCDNIQRPYSYVYCQFPNLEPIVYAECISSLMATIAQCYRDGAYYVVKNEQTGEKDILQDLDKIEPIFEKFNPEQIDNWRKIWKSR